MTCALLQTREAAEELAHHPGTRSTNRTTTISTALFSSIAPNHHPRFCRRGCGSISSADGVKATSRASNGTLIATGTSGIHYPT